MDVKWTTLKDVKKDEGQTFVYTEGGTFVPLSGVFTTGIDSFYDPGPSASTFTPPPTRQEKRAAERTKWRTWAGKRAQPTPKRRLLMEHPEHAWTFHELP